jgi:uncharacterized protein YukE
MATYSVDIATLEDAQFDLSTIYTNLRAALDRLDRSRNAFEAANIGLAVEGYTTAQMEWNAAMGDFQSAVQSAGVSIARISENYQHVDLRGQTLFQA